jgi:hypothetical protein
MAVGIPPQEGQYNIDARSDVGDVIMVLKPWTAGTSKP